LKFKLKLTQCANNIISTDVAKGVLHFGVPYYGILLDTMTYYGILWYTMVGIAILWHTKEGTQFAKSAIKLCG